MSVVSEFKEFILKGNVVDLAVGVLIGGAFGGLVKAFTTDLITPLISAFGGGKTNFGDYAPQIGATKFLVGDFINSIVSFLLLALIVFFFVVKPINVLTSLSKPSTPEPESTTECPECLSKIPIGAKRCAFCTAEQP